MCHQQIEPYINAPIFIGHSDLPFLGVLLHLSEHQETCGPFYSLWGALVLFILYPEHAQWLNIKQ